MADGSSMAGLPGDTSAAAPAPGVPPDEVPAQVLRSWDAAEAALFPLIMANPLEYQQSLALVQELLGWLREQCTDVPALLAAAYRGDVLVADTLGPAPAAGLRLDHIAAAACAMRYRELVAGSAAGRRLRAMATARADGQVWAVIEEVGDERRAPYLPYQRVEAHLPSGRALIISIGPDETLSRAIRHIDEASIDVASGALTIGPEIGSYLDLQAFEQSLSTARQRLS